MLASNILTSSPLLTQFTPQCCVPLMTSRKSDVPFPEHRWQLPPDQQTEVTGCSNTGRSSYFNKQIKRISLAPWCNLIQELHERRWFFFLVPHWIIADNLVLLTTEIKRQHLHFFFNGYRCSGWKWMIKQSIIVSTLTYLLLSIPLWRMYCKK